MQQRRSDDGRQRRNTWSGLENKNEEVVGVKRKSEKKELQGEVLDYQEEYESGGQEVATCRHDASKDLGSPCGWDVSH